jgi:peptidyl-dipeptidase Dcp
MQSAQRAMAPKIAAFRDEIAHNRALFERIDAVHKVRETSGLSDEQQRLVDVVHRRFTRQGAALADAEKHRLAEVNQRLATLYTQFTQNTQADEESLILWVESETDLAGVPEELLAAGAKLAEEHGRKGAWAFPNTRSAMDPLLTFADNRDLRERALKMWASRGDNGDSNDNNAIITEILKLRVEKASLLGFESFAHWVADGQMAKTPDAAMGLLRRVWGPAAARAREEIGDLASTAAAEGSNEPIEAWDYRYYSEKVRQAKYDLSDDEVKPYLQLSKLREAMFWVAGELWGLEFQAAPDVPVYHPDVDVFEITKAGRRVGLWYFDLFARPGKRSGAWMSQYRMQQHLKGVTPIISNSSNFIQGAPGEPVLISWTDAVTLFHEFGHGLHGLTSDVTYPSLAGTSVLRDFVELPSQLNERWLPTPELLSKFAVHVETGEPMPKDLTDKVLRAQTFREGFNTVEYLACAILDLEAHLSGNEALDARQFEREALDRLGMPREIIMRHRLPHFAHAFSSEGYAAGYYNYIWADALTADAAEAFAEAPGGFYDKALADKLLREILSVGNTRDPAEAYRRFRGRDHEPDALLRSRGFAEA